MQVSATITFGGNAALAQGDTLDRGTSAYIWSAGSKTRHDGDFLLVHRKAEVTHSTSTRPHGPDSKPC